MPFKDNTLKLLMG